MRILYINTLYSPHVFGGAERVLQTQAEAMASAGHEVAVLSISGEPGLSLTSINGIPVWRAGIRNFYFHYDELRQRRYGPTRHALWHILDSYNPFMRRYITQVVGTFHPEVASCHNLAGWSISAWDALTVSRVPIVQVIHDQYFVCANSMMYRKGHRCATQCAPCRTLRLPHRKKSRLVDTLVGVSQFVCDKLLGYGLFSGVRTARVIPNILSAPAEAFPDTPRRENGQMVFGYIGRLTPSKGIELLLTAFLETGSSDWKLIVAGSGEVEYEAYLKKHFQHPTIEFAGSIPPQDFFPKIDVSVVPSVWEDTLPSVIFESLLYGRPVLGSRLGGIPEMLNSGNGYLISPGDLHDLRRGLGHMVSKQAYFRQRFREIQEDARGYRDVNGWIRQWSDVYSEAVQAHSINMYHQ